VTTPTCAPDAARPDFSADAQRSPVARALHRSAGTRDRTPYQEIFMRRASALVLVLVGLGSALLPACSSSNGSATCSLTDPKTCKEGLICEQVVGGTTGCFAPVSVKGKVVDGASKAAVAGARVIARDVDGAAVSGVATTGPDGTYSLKVPALRDAKGVPQSKPITLRADAQGYQSFPGGIRIALPVDLKDATGEPPVLEAPPTTIALFSLNKTGLGRVSGVVKSPLAAGALVVAQGGATAVADRDGSFVVFNVDPGMRELRGYAVGVNLAPATVNVVADMDAGPVTLTESGPANGSVRGNVNLVNAPGGSVTSVVLAVQDTFNEALERGDIPVGLRARNVTGAFEIKNVPDGRYVVLSAYENDGLVRDPDPNIAGTQIPRITVAGAAVDAGNFKVTGALDVVSPGANEPEKVTGTPTFVWKDDSSEDGYQVVVFDTFGTKLWENLMIPSQKGAKDVSVPYGGPALVPGGWYQFRATSMKAGAPISRTEELRGVFIAN
jgi:hypothetical protein